MTFEEKLHKIFEGRGSEKRILSLLSKYDQIDNATREKLAITVINITYGFAKAKYQEKK